MPSKVKKKKKVANRRKRERNVLDVKLRSDQLGRQRTRVTYTVLSTLFGVLFIVFLAWRGVDWTLNEFVYTNPAFSIRKVEVTTDGYLTRETILHWGGVRHGANVMALDLSQIKRDLERIPIVKAASLERILPDALRVKVAERFPIARVTMLLPGDSGYYPATVPLDADGFVLVQLQRAHVRDQRVLNYNALPEIKGFDESELRTTGKLMNPNMLAALRLVRDFRHSELVGSLEMKELKIDPSGILMATTGDGMRVKFSAEHDFRPQLIRWRQIVQVAQESGRQIADVDLSVTNNVPVIWREVIPASGSKKPSRRAAPNRVALLNNV